MAAVSPRIPSGINLNAALKRARELGCDVNPIRSTGEVSVRHPRMQKPQRLNYRRKDSPRGFVVWLRKLDSLNS
jgi:hypothetical protein